MQTGDNQRCIEETEDSAEENSEVSGDTGHDECGYPFTDLPADRAEDEVSSHDSQQQ